jgi:hypothetical protein
MITRLGEIGRGILRLRIVLASLWPGALTDSETTTTDGVEGTESSGEKQDQNGSNVQHDDEGICSILVRC